MSLLSRRLLVVTGKGGVGKSTVTAALALAAAARGGKVLVCEVNTDERISALLGARPVGAEIGPLAPGVEAVVIRPREAMREYALMQLKVRALYNVVFENRLVARFLRFIPSLSELVMLGKILFHVRQERWDLVLVDAPATGHGIAFLRVPRALCETLPAGPMRREAEWMQQLLEDPAVTAVNLVSLPEELAITETLELADALHQVLELPPGHAFLNRFVEPRFSRMERDVLAGASSARLDALAAAAQAWSGRADRAAAHLARLQGGLHMPVTPLPQLAPRTDFGREEVEALAARIGEAIAGGRAA
jgi:anion-transporting  ArsA/GET3 family ATPase